MRIVQKFGGSSLADLPRLRRAAGICLEARRRGNEVLALARAGSQVLHAESVRLAMAAGRPIRLLSAFTASPGSEVRTLGEAERPALAGVTRDEAAHCVTLAGREAAACAASLLESGALPAGSVEGCTAAGNSARFRVKPGEELAVLRAVHRAVFAE